MKQLKIACTAVSKDFFKTERPTVCVEDTDFTDVAAIVVTASEKEVIKKAYATKLGIPVFVKLEAGESLDSELVPMVYHVIDDNKFDETLYNRKLKQQLMNMKKEYYHLSLVA